MKALGIIAWIAISTLASALLNAWALATVWRWFAAVQYGAGPSMGAWFELAMIARLALHGADVKKSDAYKDADWGDIVLHQIVSWLLVLTSLGAAWIVGAVVGWLP